MEYPISVEARLLAVATHLHSLCAQLGEMSPEDPYSVLERMDGVFEDLDAVTEGLEALEGTATLAVDAELVADATDAQIRAALDDWNRPD